MRSALFVDRLEKPDKEVKDIGEKRIENNLKDSCDHTPKFRRFKSSCQIMHPNFCLIIDKLESNMEKEKYG